jgi:hypothetical protein
MIETSRKLLRVFLENMFIPALVGTEELDEAVKSLKEGAVHYVRRRFGADIDLTAMHFGKSTRWIYRVLARQGEEEVARRSGRRSSEEDSGELTNGSNGGQNGYPLMVAAVKFYLSRSPQSLPASACVRALRKEGFEINAVELAPLLDMYCGMGYLTKIIAQTGGDQEVRYQAQNGNMSRVASAESKSERLSRVGARSTLIFPIARAYVEGVPDTYFLELQGAVLPEEYLQLSRDIRDFAVKGIDAAVKRSLERDPDEDIPRVHFRGLYLMGTGPWSEPLSAGQTTAAADELHSVNPPT